MTRHDPTGPSWATFAGLGVFRNIRPVGTKTYMTVGHLQRDRRPGPLLTAIIN